MTYALQSMAILKKEKKIVNSIEYIFSEAGLKSHKWISSCPEILSDLDEKDKLKDHMCKVLGMSYDSKSDVLLFD